MPYAEVVQLSDPHLSGRHGWFYDNFRTTVAAVEASAPDLVVVTGDLSVNGADDGADLAFAAGALVGLPSPWVALPGNHDIGEEPECLHLGQPIDASRLGRYLGHFGADRFEVELAGWRLVGLDSQLLGSGLSAEEEQHEWLRGVLGRGDGPVGVFLHKPLYLDDPDEAASVYVLPPAARRRTLALLATADVRFVSCGHLHQQRILERGGVTWAWAPSCAFPASAPLPGATAPLGYLRWRLHDDGRFAVEVVEVDALVRHDLAALKGNGRYEFLYQTPPHPVALVPPRSGDARGD